MWVRQVECWGYLCAVGGDLQIRCPQWLMRRLLDGVHAADSRIHVRLMPSENPICCPSNHFPSASCEAQDSVLLWVGGERNEPLWLHHTQLRKQILTHTQSLSPAGEITCWLALSWHWAVLPHRRGDVNKVRLFLTLSNVSKLISFCSSSVLQLFCWTSELSQRLCRWLSKTACFTGFQTTTKRDWSWFMDHHRVNSQDQGQYGYYQMYGVDSTPPRSFGYQILGVLTNEPYLTWPFC